MSESKKIDDIASRIAHDTGGFTGGKLEIFEDAGKFSFASLKRNGLRPESRVLDLGCGALRLGYWLIPFLDAERYFGIEPSQKYVDAGLKHAIGPELTAQKRPQFRHTKDFDFSIFGVKFDFVVARSIFSHASPEEFTKAMESFRDNSTGSAIMLASYRPARARDGDASIVDPDPEGRPWRLRRYSLKYLQEKAREHGLFADKYGTAFNGQVWLRLGRREQQADESAPE
jgi:SAM-dependent methyltransferase